MTLTLSHLGAQNHHLWYARPASHWLEALPVGNSHLGAMVYGGTDTEEIQLNEETFWSGSPHSNNSTESLQALPEVRRLIFEGKEQEASKLIDKYFVKGPHGMRFLPMGSLKLTLGHTEAKDYRRELNLGDAQSDEAQKSGPKNMLDSLPNTFNETQLEALRLELGKSKEGTKHQLNVWKNRGFITFSSQTGLYTKTEEYLKGVES